MTPGSFLPGCAPTSLSTLWRPSSLLRPPSWGCCEKEVSGQVLGRCLAQSNSPQMLAAVFCRSLAASRRTRFKVLKVYLHRKIKNWLFWSWEMRTLRPCLPAWHGLRGPFPSSLLGTSGCLPARGHDAICPGTAGRPVGGPRRAPLAERGPVAQVLLVVPLAEGLRESAGTGLGRVDRGTRRKGGRS